MGKMRILIADDHEVLVRSLTEMCDRRGWQLNIVAMERLSKEEQLAIAARTTVSTLLVFWDRLPCAIFR